MEFLVRQSSRATGALPRERQEELRQAERVRAAELREAGILVRLWRVLGSTDSIGLYQAEDADALHDALQSLPMFPWMRFTVEPLVTHPQERALREGQCPPSFSGDTRDRAGAIAGAPAQESPIDR
jgi:muconolactone D-isomerase